MKIKVGYIVSYDYYMLLTSIKQIYDDVTRVYVAIDEDFVTWSGNKFHIPDSFFEEVKSFDVDSKIEIYRDNFYVPDLQPMECETRERNLLLNKMGKGWLMQLDVDEYVYDFPKLKSYLKKHSFLQVFPKLTPIAFKGNYITLFKQVPKGFLYIENNENFAFITNYPKYNWARTNPNIRRFFTNFKVLHQSWARPIDQIENKIRNWGHRDDFDTFSFLEYWKKLDEKNFNEYKNFHPMSPKVWNKLYFQEATDIDDFILKYSQKNPQKLFTISKKDMIKSLLKKIIKKR
jgi:hypothetical protein